MKNSGWSKFWLDERKAFIKIMALSTNFFARQLILKLKPHMGDTLLDYGCGPGLLADALATSGVKITGADINSFFLEEYKRKHPTAEVIHVSPDLISVEQTLNNLLRERKFDYVVLLSITQYFKSADDLFGLLQVLRRFLSDKGRIILADVIPPDHSSISDGLSLLKHCIRKNYMIEMVIFMKYLFSSSYRSHASRTPLLQLSQRDIEKMSDGLKLKCREVPDLTIHSRRTNFILEV